VGGLSPARLAYAWSQYEGEVRATDDMLGRLFALMRENGVWEETLVVVTADHGEEFFDHGMRGHKNNLYAETVHVPLIVKYPGSHPSGRDARLASLVDVLPTVLETAGLATDGHSDGHSLTAAPVPDRAVLLELLALSYEGRKFPSKAYWGGIRTSERKLLWRERRQDDAPTGEVELIELFDVAADPLEQRNIAAERRDEVQELTRRFTAAAAPARVVATRHGDGGTAAIGDDDRARLRALGYIE
jgi:choline-sulfatase